MNKERILLFARILTFYTLLVILWGAWVRISHSGNGCGDTWPLCHGQLIPEAAQNKTWVEYTHRLMSGIYGLVVIFFFWRVKKVYKPQSLARSYAIMILVFMITEALLGAKLVLFGLVGSNSSAFRTFAMSLHQVNSLLLMGSTAAFVVTPNLERPKKFLSQLLKSFFSTNVFLFALILIAVTGAWAALSTTLFPSTTLLDGFKHDFAAQSHFLLRIRLSHPVLALLLMGSFVVVFYRRSLNANSSEEIRRTYFQTSLIGAITLVVGILTLFLLSPVPLKLIHLAMAHVFWIALIRQAVISLDSAKR